MKKCKQCNVYIKNDKLVCPLCQHGLEVIDQEAYEPAYPEISFNLYKFQTVVRICIFISIVLVGILMFVNYMTYSGVWWSAICGISIGYFWLTIKFSIQNNTNHATKILVQTIGAMGMMVFIDWIMGYQGWSVNFVLPSIILVAYLIILILMGVNFMNWQSYLLFQIELFVLSFLLVILDLAGLVTNPIMTYIAAAITGIVLIGTIIFGDRKAKNELKRRFHI